MVYVILSEFSCGLEGRSVIHCVKARDLPRIVQAAYHLIPYFIFSAQEGKYSPISSREGLVKFSPYRYKPLLLATSSIHEINTNCLSNSGLYECVLDGRGLACFRFRFSLVRLVSSIGIICHLYKGDILSFWLHKLFIETTNSLFQMQHCRSPCF
ncbi:retinol dehydrogenase 12-like [Gossypium australe]|uniref:Retinol dehydrogenase 12-like n=1 Tax=Gossypium australe TaxID=47621 RepID=A0A5B6UQ57_9ROSI|nr:retinol dehydrogenase 12-like [Gossypium australe]